MTPIGGTIHPEFHLLGVPFSRDAVIDAAYSMIKEGEFHEREIGDFIMDWLSDMPDITVQTSGTSGVPNPIRVDKSALVNSALATGEYFNLKPGDKCLLCLPATYIAGKMMIVRALVLGLDLYIEPPTSKPLARSTRDFDFCAMVPLQVLESLEHLHRIDKLIVGGAPLPDATQKKLVSLPTSVYETFGMTETLSHIAVRPVHIPGEVSQEYFKALPGIDFALDERGCLVIHAPHLGNKAVITNDMVELKDNTTFNWLGRIDNVVNTGGIKVFPEHVEKKLEGLVSNRFFLAGEPDKKLGERLVLFIEGDVNLAQLENSIKSHKLLKPFEIPKAIKKIKAFKETKSGKIHRKKTLNNINK